MSEQYDVWIASPRRRRIYGPVVGVLVCGRCGRRDIGQVRRDHDGRDWLAVTSWRWRAGIVTRSIPGNRPDFFDMQLLASDTGAKAWCRKCATWTPVDLEAARAAIRVATPTRPARIVVIAQNGE